MQEIINAVVIDDEAEHILEITTALGSKGISTIPVHYKDPHSAYVSCAKAAVAHPRVIITDIQMRQDGAKPTKTDIANVTKCLIKIINNTKGPYIILAWTSVPDSFDDLKDYVLKYFEKINIRGPLYFDKICKNECRPDGSSFSADKILDKFSDHLDSQKQIRALMHWERSMLNSATASVNDLFYCCEKSNESIEAILNALAKGVAGKNLCNFGSIAINEALSYLLKDKVSQSNFDSRSKEIWKQAIGGNNSEINSAAKHRLNSLLHFDYKPSEKMICPGDMWELGKEEEFFKLICGKNCKDQIDRFKEEFLVFVESGYTLEDKIKKARKENYKEELKNKLKGEYTSPKKIAKKNLKIIAVEISPVCDFSNRKKALKSLILGVLVSKEFVSGNVITKTSDSITICPIMIEDQECVLALSAKYILSMSGEMILDQSLENKKLLRVRESILQSWIHKISFYNSRIGTVSFD